MPVSTISARVLIEGKELPVAELPQWSGSAGDDLPGRLSTSSGLKQRTATVKFAPQETSADFSYNPWGADYPSAGKKAEIFVTIDGIETKVFTGKIDTTTIDAYGFPVSQLVDNSDSLDIGPISMGALLKTMPGRANSNLPPFSPGASAHYMLNRVLAECGYTTAKDSFTEKANGLIFSAPLQGSLWTAWENNLGATDAARKSVNGAATEAPVFTQSATGEVWLQNGYAEYGWSPAPSWDGSGSQTVNIRLRVGAWHSGTAWVTVSPDVANPFGLKISGRTVTVVQNGSDTSLTATIPSDSANHWVTFEADSAGAYLYIDEKNVNSNGNLRPYANSQRFGKFIIRAEGTSRISHVSSRVGATQIWEKSPLLVDKYTAQVNLPSWALDMDYVPSVREQSPIDFINMLAKILCCMVWYDGEGVLHIEYAGSLRKNTSLGNLALSDSMSAPVKSDLLMCASKVVVSSDRPEQTRTKTSGAPITLWQGDGGTLEANETKVTWVNVPEDEDWFEVDTTFSWNQANSSDVATMNNQNGSVYATEMAGYWWGDNSFSCQTVGRFAYKLTMKSLGNPVSLNFPQQVTELKDVVKGDKTPIMRGGAKIVQVSDGKSVATTDATTAPALEHEMGIWGQGTRSQTLANEVATYCGKKFASYIQEAKYFFNPLIDVGTVWDLDLFALYGQVFKILCLGVSHNPSDGSTSVTLRIIS